MGAGEGAGRGRDVAMLVKREYRVMVASTALGDITVSELCRRAGVSRKTFYTYFKDRDDVLVQIIQDDIATPVKQLFPLFGTANEAVSTQIFHEKLYTTIYENRDFYQRVVTQNRERIFVHALQTCIMDCNAFVNELLGGSKTKKFEYASRFLAAGQTAIVVKWIREGMDVPPAEIASWFNEWSIDAVHCASGR